MYDPQFGLIDHSELSKRQVRAMERCHKDAAERELKQREQTARSRKFKQLRKSAPGRRRKLALDGLSLSFVPRGNASPRRAL